MQPHPNEILISIIIPTYNRSMLLSKTIGSILNQSYRKFEILVIDDGSTDNTSEVISNIKDNRLLYFKIDRTKDIAMVRNFGLSVANSDVISFCDDDDLWDSKKLEKQMIHISDFNIICTGVALIDSEDRKIENSRYKCSGQLQVFEIEDLLVGNFIITSSVLFRRLKKETFKEHNSTNSAEDYQLWLEIAQNNEILKIDEPLVLFRVHANTSSFKSNNIYSGLLKNVLRILSIYSTAENSKISNYAKYGIIKNRRELSKIYSKNKDYFSWLKNVMNLIVTLLDIRFLFYYLKNIKSNIKTIKRVII